MCWKPEGYAVAVEVYQPSALPRLPAWGLLPVRCEAEHADLDEDFPAQVCLSRFRATGEFTCAMHMAKQSNIFQRMCGQDSRTATHWASRLGRKCGYTVLMSSAQGPKGAAPDWFSLE